MTMEIITGDCRDVLPTLTADSFDSCVTDPPYGLSFMGKEWDHGVPGETFWREVLRTLKPGAHLLAFGGTRTYHRLTCAIEDAGFEVRDCIMWVYGSGFPKSLNLGGQWSGWGTALKPAYEPIIVARKPLAGTVAANVQRYGTGAINVDGCRVGTETLTYAAGETGGEGGKYGARKRAESPTTVTGRWPANLIHDGSEEVVRLFPDEAGGGFVKPYKRASQDYYSGAWPDSYGGGHGDTGSAARFFASFPQEEEWNQSSAGIVPSSLSLQSALAASVASGAATWPSLAGIVSAASEERSTSVTEIESRTLCECVITVMAPIASGCLRESRHEKRTPSGSLVNVVAVIDQTGTTTITASLSKSGGSAASATSRITPSNLDRGDQVSRFSYCAKASREDREEWCDELPVKLAGEATGGRKEGSVGLDNPRAGASRGTGARNHHPTVKPHDLMRYLCRLVTPPGGLILDPFAGSGSTAKAALAEGFRCVSIELDPEYAEIIRRRARGQAGLPL